jgi:stage II sporulation protein D
MVVTALLAMSACASAQQTDVTVRLFSLYGLNSIQVEAEPNLTIQRCGGCAEEQLHGTMILWAAENKISVDGKTSRRIELRGHALFQLPDQRSEIIHTPVEITASHGRIRLITRMPVEDYVAAVVQGETAGDMPPEALKAMAVVARTYTARHRGRHGTFDFCDSTHCQYMRAETNASVREAVEQTRGETLWVRGTQVSAYYHKDCGGHPELATALWPREVNTTVAAHADPYCVRVSQPWRAEISRNDMTRALTASSIHLPPGWNRIIVAQRTASGRAATLLFTAGSTVNGARIAASTLRFALGRTSGWQTLKSDLYEVSATGDRFTFVGRGVGHGVGLCQTGAAEMAREGISYGDILAFYFPGALIGRSAQGIPWQTHRASALDVQFVSPDDKTRVATAAEFALRWAESRTGLSVANRPVVAVYPTIEMYRDSTGEPGWVAATTRENVIRLQPLNLLGSRLAEILRHEFVHLLLEANASSGTPLWFREGLAIYLSGEGGVAQVRATSSLTLSQIDDMIRSRRSALEMKQAYAAAAAHVRALARSYGYDQLLRWLRSGLPASILNGSRSANARQTAQ